MAVVEILQNETRLLVEAEAGTLLQTVLQQAVPDFPFPCGGAHTCGKCMVKLSGAASVPGDGEWRQACCTTITGDCRVTLSGTERSQQIARGFSAALHPGEPLYPGDYGVAIDIGTTTVVAYLYRRGQAQPIAALGQMNRQRACGSDVLSRIVYCDEHTVQPLQTRICAQLDAMLTELCAGAAIPDSQLGGCCITGNTTMLHILAGLDPHTISVAPFTPQTLFGQMCMLPLPKHPSLQCYLPPCISAYVGADISCSILSAGLARQEKTALLIDVGTNGEIALYHKGQLFCCSTAAGPAFEGACISCGMQAQAGAIDKVWCENGALHYHVLGECKPNGICGSGLIDALCAARQAGLLDKKGRPVNGGDALAIADSGVSLTRKDLSELLLAKAAIRAGIDTLLLVCGIAAEQVPLVILCGGFGSYLDIASAVGIGLLPESFRTCASSIGNAAGAGAGMVLQDKTQQAELHRIVSMAQTVTLSGNPAFTKQYVASMRLP